MLIKSGGILPVSTLDPATTAWIAAVIANGGTVSNPRRVLVNSLIVGLRADGIFTELDRLWLFAAENEPSALTDIVKATTAIKDGSPIFLADDGYTGATNAWIESSVIPATTPGLVFSQDSGSIFAWATANVQVAAPLVAGDPPGVSTLYPRYSDDNSYWRLSGPEVSTPTADGSGFWCNVRDSATTNPLYRNGSAYGVNNTASTGAGTSQIVFLARPATGIEWYTANCACAGIGGGLTATDASNLYNRLRTYMTAIGVP